MDLSAVSFAPLQPCRSNSQAYPQCRCCHRCFDTLLTTFHMPARTPLKDAGTRIWTWGGVFACANYPDHPLLLTSQLHHSALVQYLYAILLCALWAQPELLPSDHVLVCQNLALQYSHTGLRSRSFMDNLLTWDFKAIYRQLKMYSDACDFWK